MGNKGFVNIRNWLEDSTKDVLFLKIPYIVDVNFRKALFKMWKALDTHALALKQLVVELHQGSLAAGGQAELVKICRIIIEAYLRLRGETITRLSANHGLSITDMAYDCIAEAFSRVGENRFPLFERFANSFGRPVANVPEPELFLAFKAFLIRFADAQLGRMYAQMDPMGARIHRNLRDAACRSELFSLHLSDNGKILRPRNMAPLDSQPCFPPEELYAQLVPRLHGGVTSPQIFAALHSVLAEETRYTRTIPVRVLVQLVKKFTEWNAVEIYEEQSTFNFDGLAQFEIEQIQNQVRIVIREKILLTYLARRKVNRREAEAICLAFDDIIAGWCNGDGAVESLRAHLQSRLPMDETTYQRDFRPKMEYLNKIAREEFAALMMREF